jgi:iron complex outermembrane receptor protein
MRRFAASLLFMLVIAAGGKGQAPQDSTRVLDELTVEAYAAHRDPASVPAGIGVVRSADLQRFSTATLLPAFNLTPGVRMEERSPGSYRFSVRGSLIRSPFGVRNVKFYWNGLPFTDGGGNTYLNLIDPYALNAAEIIKGPAGSLYGAGTGGAVLLTSAPIAESVAGITLQAGSYGSWRLGGSIDAASETIGSRVDFVRQQSDGYREQSAMRRNAVHADFSFFRDASNALSLTMLYTDLFYQTPGGLTEAQYQANPAQARPDSPAGPGAVAQQAAVYNRSSFSGLTYEHYWSKSWTSIVGLVGSITDFLNPAIRNYEKREERNLGGRITNLGVFQFDSRQWRLTFGAEYQQLVSPVRVTNNLSGVAGPIVMSDDELTYRQASGFAQIELIPVKGLQVTTGLSVNYAELIDKRTAPAPAGTSKRSFNPAVLPRIALFLPTGSGIGVYASASRGYSLPTTAEVMPSNGIYNPTLRPESGWSYEAGMKGHIGQFEVQLSFYDFQLSDAIVLQRDSTGADYYINGGDTNQRGIEFTGSWSRSWPTLVQTMKLTTSVAYQPYHFGNYVNDGNDYSGNPITGVPPVIAVVGADAELRKGFYARTTFTYVDRISLNDAATDYASSYFLVGARLGVKSKGKLPLDAYAGVDNAFNQRYSLGNDLNAAGKRYFNAAPPANFYVGLTTKLPLRKGGGTD